MSFLYPLGLLGLIGVPILIIIYIIKNKYTESVIASTYIWTLSEKFLKRRLPINKFVGIISLILQILAVIFISVAVAHPVLTLPNSANDYLFVLDGSGSMNITREDKTRLDFAKEEIAEIIEDSANGSAYSLIFAGETPNVIFDKITDKDYALLLLGKIAPAYTSADFTDTLGAAQKYFNDNSSILTYFVTDKEVEPSENVQIINVSGGEENYAVTDVAYSFANSDNFGKLTVTGSLVSYESDAELEIKLFLNGNAEPAYEQKADVKKLQSAPFAFVCEETNFESLKVVITNKDALAMDNEVVVYNVEYENSYKVLLVSDTPFFMTALLQSVGNASVKTVSTETYSKTAEEAVKGRDLCIFDTYTPDVLPDKAAIWFINPQQSVAKSGFTVQNEIEKTVGVKADYTNSTKTIYKTLLRDVLKEDVYIKKYQKCRLDRKDFLTLVSCDDNPLIFTGTNEYRNREVVFAFKLNDTNLAPVMDFITLSRNLLDYMFPTVIDESSYYSGETLQVNVTANCDSIRLESPSGKISYLDTSSAVSEVKLTEVGTYTVTLMSGETARVFRVYSALPEEERIPAVKSEAFSLVGEAGKEKRDGVYDDLMILFILLALIFAADWMVYCYEQYQLR